MGFVVAWRLAATSCAARVCHSHWDTLKSAPKLSLLGSTIGDSGLRKGSRLSSPAVREASTALPTGTVTFLFTDIEGSTRLLKKLGRDRYGDVLSTHNRLLRAAFAEVGGIEIDTKGDSFFVVFRSAGTAIEAAAAGQLALAEHNWADDVQVRVRMGLHT